MRTYIYLVLAVILSCGIFAFKAETKKEQSQNKPKVEVYYFHFTQRCSTCIALEENSKKALESLYPDKIKSNEYSFKALNLDEKDVAALAKKYDVSGQTLLFVCGKKKVDLTDKGFLNAHDVEKLKIEIKKAVEQVTK